MLVRSDRSLPSLLPLTARSSCVDHGFLCPVQGRGVDRWWLRLLIAFATLTQWTPSPARAAEPPASSVSPTGSTSDAESGTLRIGSKRFTESYVLGEILTQTVSNAVPGLTVRHIQGLGNTAILLQALKQGDVDLYVEYSGTIALEILRNGDGRQSLDELNRGLAASGLAVAVPLGFENSYALAVGPRSTIGAKTLSQLADYPRARLGLSHEFLGRADGWPGLASTYRLTAKPTGLDHGLAYEALAADQVDVIDIYSTDAKIARYDLRLLDDDLHYFPSYQALVLYRLDLPSRFPQAWTAIRSLQGRIDATRMTRMNAAAELQGIGFAAIAREFVAHPDNVAAPDHQKAPPDSADSSSKKHGSGVPASAGADWWSKLWGPDFGRLLAQHLSLVALSVLAACLIGIPLGVIAASPRIPAVFGKLIMATVAVLQTIPSLALLAFLIPLLGRIGTAPALLALFAYALLPIVRNTVTGLTAVPHGLRQAALALGLSTRTRLWSIDLPLARPVLLAGIRTAAVISVGTATIAAFIGAGGFGERITTGLALNDHALLVAGALPAAAMALLIDGLFELLARIDRRPGLGTP